MTTIFTLPVIFATIVLFTQVIILIMFGVDWIESLIKENKKKKEKEKLRKDWENKTGVYSYLKK